MADTHLLSERLDVDDATPSRVDTDPQGVPLPSTGEVLQTIRRFGLTRGWLTRHQAILWVADIAGVETLCIASTDIERPALLEAADQLTAAPACFRRVASNDLLPYFAELEADQVFEAARTHDAVLNLRELAQEAPVIDFVDAMLSEAMERRASDVHIEPFADRLCVRFRIDGVLSVWRTAPRALFEAVASRIKILSGMDIAERRLPQDGRQSLKTARYEADLRVSSLPTTWGESIVLRFLGKQLALPDLGRLGFTPDQSSVVSRLTSASSGMILLTGPTGSGKTTTAYRLVTDLNDGLRKIVSVEDPVEIDLPGVLQTQVRSEIGLGFATGLRAILRQDPDVILLGEIRDAETAMIAVQAALTGHLVISTVHTTNALAAVTRLLDLGVAEYFIADVVRGVIGQRLARRVCEVCAAPDEGEDQEAHVRQHIDAALLQSPPRWRRAVGCPACSMTGYRGRIGVFEIATSSPDWRDAIRCRASEDELDKVARAHGYRGALHDGILKARAGLTTLGEVQRALAGLTT